MPPEERCKFHLPLKPWKARQLCADAGTALAERGFPRGAPVLWSPSKLHLRSHIAIIITIIKLMCIMPIFYV